MAARSWVTSICIAIGVAAGAGAAQLGLGYGLRIVVWEPVTNDATKNVWYASLAWVTWLAATSTVLGALLANWLSARESAVPEASFAHHAISFAWRVVIALAAAIGALVTVPLVALPAREAHLPDNAVPQFAAGGYAVAGVIVGLIMAVIALSGRAIAANVVASVSWLWVLAVVAVVGGVRSGREGGLAELATWQFSGSVWLRNVVNVPGALLMLGAALLIGLCAAWPIGRRGGNRVGVAISGATGPLLVAAAYLLSVPGLGGRNVHLSAYFMAPYAVIAGLAGSVLVSAIGPKGAREKAKAERAAKEAAEADEWGRSLASAESTVEAPKAKKGGAKKAGGFFDRDSDEGLEDDAYAPARAYGSSSAARAYAADTGDDDDTQWTSGRSSGKGASKSTAGSGRASAPKPLWPDDVLPATTATPSATPPSTTGKGKRGRRGKGGG